MPSVVFTSQITLLIHYVFTEVIDNGLYIEYPVQFETSLTLLRRYDFSVRPFAGQNCCLLPKTNIASEGGL